MTLAETTPRTMVGSEELDLLIRDLDILLHILIVLDEDGKWLRKVPTFESIYLEIVRLSEGSSESIASVCRDDIGHILDKDN
jgi:hypothetical protein